MMSRAGPRHRPARDADHLIEALLDAAARPLSAYDIRDTALADGDRISIPRIYRVVARLMAKGRVRRVETLNAYMAGAAGKDIIAICRHCASVTPVPIGDIAQQIRDILASRGFTVEDIMVEAQGRCRFCLAKAISDPKRNSETDRLRE